MEAPLSSGWQPRGPQGSGVAPRPPSPYQPEGGPSFPGRGQICCRAASPRPECPPAGHCTTRGSSPPSCFHGENQPALAENDAVITRHVLYLPSPKHLQSYYYHSPISTATSTARNLSSDIPAAQEPEGKVTPAHPALGHPSPGSSSPVSWGPAAGTEGSRPTWGSEDLPWNPATPGPVEKAPGWGGRRASGGSLSQGPGAAGSPGEKGQQEAAVSPGSGAGIRGPQQVL